MLPPEREHDFDKINVSPKTPKTHYANVSEQFKILTNLKRNHTYSCSSPGTSLVDGDDALKDRITLNSTIP